MRHMSSENKKNKLGCLGYEMDGLLPYLIGNSWPNIGVLTMQPVSMESNTVFCFVSDQVLKTISDGQKRETFNDTLVLFK